MLSRQNCAFNGLRTRLELDGTTLAVVCAESFVVCQDFNPPANYAPVMINPFENRYGH